MTDDQRIDELENILLSYADTPYHKALVVDKFGDTATVKDYILALADGLKYGNWPWIERHTTRALMNTQKYHNANCQSTARPEFPCNCDEVLL